MSPEYREYALLFPITAIVFQQHFSHLLQRTECMTARNRMSMYIQQYIHKQIKYNSKKRLSKKIAPFAIVYFGKKYYLTVAKNKHYSNG